MPLGRMDSIAVGFPLDEYLKISSRPILRIHTPCASSPSAKIVSPLPCLNSCVTPSRFSNSVADNRLNGSTAERNARVVDGFGMARILLYEGLFFPGHLGAGTARFRESNGNRLLSVFDLTSR